MRDPTVRTPCAAGLTFLILLLSSNAVEARVRCPAGSYYRVTQGTCVSAREFKWVLEQVRKYHSGHRGNQTYVHKTPKPQTPIEATMKTPTIKQALIVSLSALRPGSPLFEVLPPNVQLWEKQYPTQWN